MPAIRLIVYILRYVIWKPDLFFSEYATLKPELFSRFIPNVLPHTSVTELDRYIEETQNMQIEMRKLDGFNS